MEKEKRKKREMASNIDFIPFFLYYLAMALFCFASAAPAKTSLFNNQRKRTPIFLVKKKKL